MEKELRAAVQAAAAKYFDEVCGTKKEFCDKREKFVTNGKSSGQTFFDIWPPLFNSVSNSASNPVCRVKPTR